MVDDAVPDEAAAEEDVVGEHGSWSAHEYICEQYRGLLIVIHTPFKSFLAYKRQVKATQSIDKCISTLY